MVKYVIIVKGAYTIQNKADHVLIHNPRGVTLGMGVLNIKQAMGKRERIELTVMCLVHQGDLLLMQDRVKADWQGLALPGGHVEPGESIVDAVIREIREETGLEIQNPKLCGIKQFPIDGGRYLVLLFETEKFSGTLRSSEEGKMYWIPRQQLSKYNTVEDLEELLDVMLRPELTEFQYLVQGEDWKVRLR